MVAQEMDRFKSGRSAQFFVAAELTRRGYDVSLDKDSHSARLSATSPKRTSFRVQCHNRKNQEVSWVVEPFKEDKSLYFVLVVAELESPYSSPQYWTLSSSAMNKIINAYMSRNPAAKSVNVMTSDVKQYEGWTRLPQ